MPFLWVAITPLLFQSWTRSRRQWLHGGFDDILAFQDRCFPDDLIHMNQTIEPWAKRKAPPAETALFWRPRPIGPTLLASRSAPPPRSSCRRFGQPLGKRGDCRTHEAVRHGTVDLQGPLGRQHGRITARLVERSPCLAAPSRLVTSASSSSPRGTFSSDALLSSPMPVDIDAAYFQRTLLNALRSSATNRPAAPMPRSVRLLAPRSSR